MNGVVERINRELKIVNDEIRSTFDDECEFRIEDDPKDPMKYVFAAGQFIALSCETLSHDRLERINFNIFGKREIMFNE